MNLNLEQLHAQMNERFPPADPVSTSATSSTESGDSEERETSAEIQPACQAAEFDKVGYHLNLTVEPDQILTAAGFLDDAGFALDLISAVDWPEDNQFELVYDFLHFENPARIVVRTRISRESPVIDTLSELYQGANWHERETAEFFGITFRGHPNPIHLLLPEDFEGFPLRKDFKPTPYES